jgi:hypothetical protein
MRYFWKRGLRASGNDVQLPSRNGLNPHFLIFA